MFFIVEKVLGFFGGILIFMMGVMVLMFIGLGEVMVIFFIIVYDIYQIYLDCLGKLVCNDWFWILKFCIEFGIECYLMNVVFLRKVLI